MHGLADLEALTIDIAQLERRRDRLVEMLQSQGYSVHIPEGSFYLFPQSPWDDDWAFCEVLADNDVFCLPGSVFEMPGYFRISVTAREITPLTTPAAPARLKNGTKSAGLSHYAPGSRYLFDRQPGIN